MYVADIQSLFSLQCFKDKAPRCSLYVYPHLEKAHIFLNMFQYLTWNLRQIKIKTKKLVIKS